jgi:hypothetical protein
MGVLWNINTDQGLERNKQGNLDTEIELHAYVDIPSHFHNLGEVNSLFRGFLQISDRKDLQSRIVHLQDVRKVSARRVKDVPALQPSPCWFPAICTRWAA